MHIDEVVSQIVGSSSHSLISINIYIKVLVLSVDTHKITYKMNKSRYENTLKTISFF